MTDVLGGHIVLDVECLDRVYLNAYVPVLQPSGQVLAFMTQHLGMPIPSPGLMEEIDTRFRRAVESYVSANRVAWVKFGKADRKIDVMQPYLQAQAATGRSGVAAIGVAQEFQRVWAAYQRDTQTAAPQYTFAKAERRVTCYYFYLWDEDFGGAFVKVCAISRIRPRSESTGTSGPNGRRCGAAADGRLFRTERGGPVGSTAYTEVWQQARVLALTPEQVASPLAGRPYDLRHAAVSLWLNGGVSPTEIAKRAGHSVEVLLRVYAKCVHGQEDVANQRIEEILNAATPAPEPAKPAPKPHRDDLEATARLLRNARANASHIQRDR